ncbi:hypothetical protein GA0115240_16458 [Streptomyces sp. DvalAA-14]|nr:hypothetical protein GA0115240_16458 [Streptomyces sp. DvalAA-14]
MTGRGMAAAGDDGGRLRGASGPPGPAGGAQGGASRPGRMPPGREPPAREGRDRPGGGYAEDPERAAATIRRTAGATSSPKRRMVFGESAR